MKKFTEEEKNEAWKRVAKALLHMGQSIIKNLEVEDEDEGFVEDFDWAVDTMKKAKELYNTVDKFSYHAIDEDKLVFYGEEYVFDYISHIGDISDELAAEMVADVFNKED